MSCTDAVVGMLGDAHFTSYFTNCLSALDCAEPIVVTEGTFAWDSRQVEEEPGSFP